MENQSGAVQSRPGQWVASWLSNDSTRWPAGWVGIWLTSWLAGWVCGWVGDSCGQRTCLVICHTQSMNWTKMGERSWSAWFLSPWPILCTHKQQDAQLLVHFYQKTLEPFCNDKHLKMKWCACATHRGKLVAKADPLLLNQHLQEHTTRSL